MAWLSEALSGEAQDGGAIDESVGGGDSGGLGGKESLPLGEAGVGGEDDGALSVPGGDDTKQIVGGLGRERFAVELVQEQYLRLNVAAESPLEGSVGL